MEWIDLVQRFYLESALSPDIIDDLWWEDMNFTSAVDSAYLERSVPHKARILVIHKLQVELVLLEMRDVGLDSVVIRA